ncbi:uncharacterized protein [Dermacentor albipictus]|uniref:uncharacterized protein n=1 Tax=Dermacentor albipictus TaxID=60249 RepID=UPI0031FC10AB
MIGVVKRLSRVEGVRHTIYADDITLWVQGGSDGHIESTLQEAVDAIEDQLNGSGLICSPSKCRTAGVNTEPERLSVLLVNCRNIKNKVDNFMSLVANVKPPIVMGTESWLDKTIPNVEIFPPGFTVYRKDRHGHGGGVFILISNALSSTEILFENNSESVWCLVKLPNGNNVVYGTFYRPPGSSDSFGLLSEMLSLLPNSVFLGGDFNLPDFNWNAGCVAGNRSHIYTAFEELLRLNGLQQYVLEPTRENAILDLVLCNEPNIISKVTICPGI